MLMTSVMTPFYMKNLRNSHNTSKYTLLSRKDARNLKLEFIYTKHSQTLSEILLKILDFECRKLTKNSISRKYLKKSKINMHNVTNVYSINNFKIHQEYK